MRCAKCKSTDVQKFENAMRGFCAVCGGLVDIEYGDEQEKQIMQVFFSYGHDDHQDFVCRLADAVMRKTDGRINVWIDTRDISVYSHWRERITNGILNSRSVLAFLSKYSARERGVCLDELAIALSSKHGMIKTVLLENSNPKDPEGFTPPAMVAEYQWANMSNYKEFADKGEEAFEEYIDMQAERIIAMLDSDEVTQYNNELSLLRKKLGLPEIAYETPRLNRLLKTPLVGRVWLTDMVNNWVEDADAKPVLMLYGKPGAGKSMFSAHLQHYNPHVAASFACNHQSDEFSDTNKIIIWLAYKLAMRLPDYRRYLLKLFEDQFFDMGSNKDRFDRLIAQPLSLCINGERGTMMIIIDALDEANGDEMAGFISEYTALLPPWLRILITARKEPHITECFKAYPHIDFEEQTENNEADIRAYYEAHLHGLLDRQADRDAALAGLVSASEGVFLYAEEICPILLEEAAKGDLDLLTFDLPQGMDNLFRFSMKRKAFTYHKDGKTYHYTDFWCEPLGLIVASPSPLPVETLKKLMGWDENDYHSFRLPLSALLTETDGCLQTFHRSFGEWLNKTGEFHSSTQDGLVNLAKRAFAVYETGVKNMDEYLLCNLTALLRTADLQNEYEIAIADDELIDAMENKANELLEYSKLTASLQLCEELEHIFIKDRSERSKNNLIFIYDRLSVIYEQKKSLKAEEDMISKMMASMLSIKASNAIIEGNIAYAYGKMARCMHLCNDIKKADFFYGEAYRRFVMIVEKYPEDQQIKENAVFFFKSMGEYYFIKGDYNKSLRRFETALEIAQQLVSRFPENEKYVFLFSVVLSQIGSVLAVENKTDIALEKHLEAVKTMRTLVQQHAEKPANQSLLSQALSNVAYILWLQDKEQDAFCLYEESLVIAKSLVSAFPDNPNYLQNLSGLLDRTALAAASQKEFDKAVELHKESLQIWRYLNDTYPEDSQLRYFLSLSLTFFEDTLKKQGKICESLRLREESLVILENLVSIYPEISSYQELLADRFCNMAEMQKNANRAVELYNEALNIYEKLSSKHENNLDYLHYRLHCAFKLVNIYCKQKKHEEAFVLQTELLWVIWKLIKKEPDNKHNIITLYKLLDKTSKILVARLESNETWEIDKDYRLNDPCMAIYRLFVDNCYTDPEQECLRLIALLRLEILLDLMLDGKRNAQIFKKHLETMIRLMVVNAKKEIFELALKPLVDIAEQLLLVQSTKMRVLAGEMFAIQHYLIVVKSNDLCNYQKRMDDILNNVSVLCDHDALQDVLSLFEENLNTDRKMATAYPENPEYRRDLSVSLERVACIMKAQNRRNEARELYKECIAIREQLCEQFPQSQEYIQSLVLTYYNCNITVGDYAAKIQAYNLARAHSSLPICKSIMQKIVGK